MYVVNGKRQHKFAFRKSRIKAKYPAAYDESLTEHEMMTSLNYYRIYDSGKIKYVLQA